jgi:hypothetical protein
VVIRTLPVRSAISRMIATPLPRSFAPAYSFDPRGGSGWLGPGATLLAQQLALKNNQRKSSWGADATIGVGRSKVDKNRPLGLCKSARVLLMSEALLQK